MTLIDASVQNTQLHSFVNRSLSVKVSWQKFPQSRRYKINAVEISYAAFGRENGTGLSAMAD